MSLTIKPATSEDDGDVISLFESVEIPIEAPYWMRSFSPDQPEEYISTPYLARDLDDRVVAFAVSRPRLLVAGKELIQTQILSDLIFHPTQIFSEGHHEFLQFLLQKKELTFVAGAGLELTRILDRERFLRAGTMSRFRFSADAKAPQMADEVDLRPGFPTEAQLQAMLQLPEKEGKFHFSRSADWMRWMHEGPAASSREVICGFSPITGLLFIVASRSVKGAQREEMHVVDALCPQANVLTMIQALAQKAVKRKMDLYWSFFGSTWGPLFEPAGYERLRPRWPVLWMIRDPKQRSLMNLLLRLEQWHFLPVDGEIDHS